MVERNVIVRTEGGLHAIVATRIAAIAEDCGAKVLLALTGDPLYQVDASKLMAVLSLGVAAGESLTVTCDGAGADRTLNAIVAVLSDD
ncbi:HPr family phosphocarrier protein [Arthrobacter sp. NPDC092385]|uniref:HPr family phosphocarrier protein n=1 Tax=Arthrobacter sp. NPDC092385 TaxID=3363943 RepID=UPI0037F9DCF2